MRFRLVESFNLSEHTAFESEVGQHILADIRDGNVSLSGLRKRVIQKYFYEIMKICRSIDKTNRLFRDVCKGDWTVHHIDGVHVDNKIDRNVLHNLSLVRTSIHKQLTDDNYRFIGTRCKQILPTINSEEADKLILRLLVICSVHNIDPETIFSFNVEGFDDFLLKSIPRELTDRFFKKYPASCSDVILLRDIV